MRTGTWLLAALLAVLAVWALTEAKLAHDRSRAESDAYLRASSIAGSYAEQIERTFDEVDRATLLAAQLWQTTGGRIRLDEYYRNGIFPDAFFHVSVGRENGDVATSTLPLANPLNFADRNWFQAHRSGRVNGLLISEPETGPRTGRPIVRLSRSMFDDKGMFAGVVWVTLEPPYLTSFYGGRQLSRDEFISIRLLHGPVLATKVGADEGPSRIFYLKHPVFPKAEGVAEESADKFADGADRIVGWKNLRKYPVMAMAGLKKDEVFAEYAASAALWRSAATAFSLLLAGFAGFAAYYSARLAARKDEADEVREIYRMAVDAAQEGFYMLRPLHDAHGHILDFRVEDCNERAASFVGRVRSKILGRTLSEIFPAEYQRHTDAVLRRVMSTGFFEEEFRMPSTASGAVMATWLYRRYMKSGNGVAMVVRDISRQKAHEQELLQLANTDALTGLPNRHWLLAFLPEAIRRAEEGMMQLAVIFIDLDDFKNINDTLGHDAGDELLRAVAARLKKAVRSSDHVIRLGGDEFTVVLEQVDGKASVAQVANQIIKSLAEPLALGGSQDQRMRASLGISMIPDDGRDGETLLKHADIAMYAAKAAGKSRYHFYHAQLSDTLVLRLRKEHALRQAVERDEFIIHFQPRVGTSSGELSSMEALVRWMHPERGMVYPAEFIDIAEDTGLITRLGELVIEKACAQLAQWQSERLRLVPVSVNVSPQQLRSGSVSAFIADCLRRHGIDASLIEVELTESAVIDRSSAVAAELQALRLLGVRLMIDDFGTGHSSLAQLHGLDVDALKVDKAFTDALCSGSEGKILYQAIVSMADALDMCVVAEGVETAEQLQILQSLDCDEIQGFLISEALPADALPAMLARRILTPASLYPRQSRIH